MIELENDGLNGTPGPLDAFNAAASIWAAGALLERTYPELSQSECIALAAAGSLWQQTYVSADVAESQDRTWRALASLPDILIDIRTELAQIERELGKLQSAPKPRQTESPEQWGSPYGKNPPMDGGPMF